MAVTPNILFLLSDWQSVHKNFPHLYKIQYKMLYNYINGLIDDMN